MPGQRHRITDQYSLVKRKGSDRWYLEWREPRKGKQRAATGTAELGKALVRARELILARLSVTDAPVADIAVMDVLDSYRLQHGAKVASQDVMRRAIALWREHWTGLAVSAVTPAEQERFVGKLRARKFSDGYIRRVLAVGKAALNRAYKRGVIASAPYVELPPISEPWPHVATRDQLVRFLNTPMPDHIRMYVMIRLCTGCRGDAALDLQPFQVHGQDGFIQLNPPGRAQTKKYRATVPLTDALAAMLAKHSGAEWYVNWQGHKVASIKTTWRKIREAAKLPAWWAPKVLRHTVATELRRRGVPAWEASGQLGHRVGGTTEIYAKFDPQYLGAARAALDAWLLDLARDVPWLAVLLAKKPEGLRVVK